jgi:hypothetical protein
MNALRTKVNTAAALIFNQKLIRRIFFLANALDFFITMVFEAMPSS